MKRIFVIQDMHIWNKNISNRKDYISECITNFNTVENIVKSSRRKYMMDKIYIVFLGDIFHQGFGDDSLSFNIWVQKFQMLRAVCNGIYFVVGNHELSYKEKNPFWSLMNEIKSNKLKKYKVECYGALPIATLTDYLDIDGIRLHFNHYGTPIENILGNRNNILFSHEYWMTDNMFNSLEKIGGEKLKRQYLRYNKITDTSVIKNFKLCFFGHMHRFQSQFKIVWDNKGSKETILYHLASLGLTNKDEVKNTGDTRIIPEIVFNNGEVSVVEHKIKIPNGIELLKYDTVKKQESQYEITKLRKKERQEEKEIMGMDPILYIEKELKETNELEKLDVFNALETEGGLPEWVSII